VARRSNHEGSCYQRSDGLWVVTVRLGSKRVYRYGKTKSEAAKKLQELLRQHHQGTLAQPTKLTLNEWVDRWLEGLDVRTSTLATYRQTVMHVVKVLGSERLDRLSPVILSGTFTNLARDGVGARRLHLAHGYLKACLEHAVNLEVLPRNSMAKVRRPKWDPKPRVYWSIDQTVTFLRACEASRHQAAPLFVLMATCGLRVSEALALTWGDVALERRKLWVNRAIVWSDGAYTHEAVKTRSGRREISVPEPALRALAVMPRQADTTRRIFCTASQSPLSPSNLRRSLLNVCKSAEVPPINVHGLRHVAAALAFRATGDPYVVQHRLGHSHVSTTMSIYAYGTRSDEQVAGAVDALLAQNSTDGTGEPTEPSAS
jgi:integrase